MPCLATVRPLPKARPAVDRLPAGDTHRSRVTPRSARGGGDAAGGTAAGGSGESSGGYCCGGKGTDQQ